MYKIELTPRPRPNGRSCMRVRPFFWLLLFCVWRGSGVRCGHAHQSTCPDAGSTDAAPGTAQAHHDPHACHRHARTAARGCPPFCTSVDDQYAHGHPGEHEYCGAAGELPRVPPTLDGGIVAFTMSMQADGFAAVQQTVFVQVLASPSPAHSSSPSPPFHAPLTFQQCL